MSELLSLGFLWVEGKAKVNAFDMLGLELAYDRNCNQAEKQAKLTLY